jgi:NADH:ubiquinone oxidoreductase subunit 6 (subunit J)
MTPIHWHSFFFLLFALIACLAAVAVVVSANIVRMACYLVLSLAAVAGLFFLAGADFLGAVQLMVYVGGTLVLLVFGVMLTSRGPFTSMRSSGGQWIIAILVGGSLLAVLLQTVLHVGAGNPPSIQATELQAEPQQKAKTVTTPLGLGLLGIRTDSPAASSPGYLLPFEIISIHLLVVLLGAAYLARAKRRVREKGPENTA